MYHLCITPSFVSLFFQGLIPLAYPYWPTPWLYTFMAFQSIRSVAHLKGLAHPLSQWHFKLCLHWPIDSKAGSAPLASQRPQHLGFSLPEPASKLGPVHIARGSLMQVKRGTLKQSLLFFGFVGRFLWKHGETGFQPSKSNFLRMMNIVFGQLNDGER